jgi:hypothetical protein
LLFLDFETSLGWNHVLLPFQNLIIWESILSFPVDFPSNPLKPYSKYGTVFPL